MKTFPKYSEIPSISKQISTTFKNPQDLLKI